jgi:hypothetical protein
MQNNMDFVKLFEISRYQYVLLALSEAANPWYTSSLGINFAFFVTDLFLSGSKVRELCCARNSFVEVFYPYPRV